MKLSDYLTQKNMTPETFAEKLKVDAVTVRRYLTGKRRPNWQVMADITSKTGGAVTANDFLPEPKPKKRRARPKTSVQRSEIAA